PLWIGDMVAILALCLRDPRTIGRSYELGGPAYVTFAELLRRMARLLGKRRLFVPVPTPLLWPGVWATGRLLRDPPATSDELRQLRQDNFTALDAVPRQFGFAPLPLDEHLDYIRDIATARRRPRGG
ncbi:MAG: hypothetical protein HY688_00225, partial [Chloroflexi bacterium]|nr:hypothetical protein [Chloroflexota bacterium]